MQACQTKRGEATADASSDQNHLSCRTQLDVFMNDLLVGRLYRQTSGDLEFVYDQISLSRGDAIPISVSIPLHVDKVSGNAALAVFDNLLPDSDVVRQLLSELVSAGGADAGSLLAKLGRDCTGALLCLPAGQKPNPAGSVLARPVNDNEIAGIVSQLANRPLGMSEDDEFRISLAGAQEKTAYLFWKGRWRVPHGTTPTTHIMKPQIGVLSNGIDMSQSVENEFFCLKLMEAFGLPVAKAGIADFGAERVLVVERFDRLWTKDDRLLRLPQEDCCQALSVPSGLKYERDGGPGIKAVLDLLQGSDQPQEDQRLFMTAQILFWLLGATDGHAKNFSLFLQPGGRFRLTPIYDVLSAQPAVDAGQLKQNRMKMAVAIGEGRHYVVSKIAPRHFLETAHVSGLSRDIVVKAFRDLHDRAGQAVEQARKALPRGFPKMLTTSIVNGILNRCEDVGIFLDDQ